MGMVRYQRVAIIRPNATATISSNRKSFRNCMKGLRRRIMGQLRGSLPASMLVYQLAFA